MPKYRVRSGYGYAVTDDAGNTQTLEEGAVVTLEEPNAADRDVRLEAVVEGKDKGG